MAKDNETDIVAKLADSEAKLKTLQSEHATLAETLTKIKADAEASTKAYAQVKADFEKQIAAKDKEIADLKASQADFNGKLAAALAEKGVTRDGENEPAKKDLTQKEACEQFTAMKNPSERAAFWAKNKNLILGKIQ